VLPIQAITLRLPLRYLSASVLYSLVDFVLFFPPSEQHIVVFVTLHKTSQNSSTSYGSEGKEQQGGE